MIIPDAEFLQWQKYHPNSALILERVIEAGQSIILKPDDFDFGRDAFYDAVKVLREHILVCRGRYGNEFSPPDISPDISISDEQRDEVLKRAAEIDISPDISNRVIDILADISISDKQRDETENKETKPTSEPTSATIKSISNYTPTTVTGNSCNSATATAEQGQLQLKGSTPTGVSHVIDATDLLGNPIENSPKKGTLTKKLLSKEFEEEFWPGIKKKKDKPKARTAYIKAREKSHLSAEELQKRYNLHFEAASEPKYAKYPHRWLNNECYDEGPEVEQEKVIEQQQRVTEMTSRWVQSA